MKDISSSLKLLLIQNGFKEISEQDFSSKLKSYFGITIDERDLIILVNQKEYYIDIKNKFIDTYPFEPYYIDEFIINERSENEYNKKFITYNKIIFNDDLSSITSILNNKENYKDIYFYFDYEKNNMLNHLALQEIDYKNFEPDYIQHLFLYNDKEKSIIKNHVISKILQNNKDVENYFINIIDEIFNLWENIYSENIHKFLLISVLLEKLLEKFESDKNIEKCKPLVNFMYSIHENLLDNFIKENFFDGNLLKKYSNQYLEIINS